MVERCENAGKYLGRSHDAHQASSCAGRARLENCLRSLHLRPARKNAYRQVHHHPARFVFTPVWNPNGSMADLHSVPPLLHSARIVEGVLLDRKPQETNIALHGRVIATTFVALSENAGTKTLLGADFI
jgi:hypothetical protein